MNRSTFNKSVVPGLFAFMIQGYRPASTEVSWSSFVSTRTSKRAYEECAYAGGLGIFPHKPEGEAITYDEILQGPTKKFVHKTYSLGIKLSEELIEDSLYPDIPTTMRSLTEELGRAARETKALLVWDMLNNITSTTNHTGADALALATASHTYITGGTWSNLLSPASDLSAIALQTTIDNFETIKDESGRYQILKAKYIIVNPANAWKAKELLQSGYDPESANNAINTLKERNLQLIVSPYYTDTDAFTLVAEPANRESGIIAFDRRKLSFAKDGDFDTGDAKFKGSFRFSVECAHAGNMYHSAGA